MQHWNIKLDSYCSNYRIRFFFFKFEKRSVPASYLFKLSVVLSTLELVYLVTVPSKIIYLF